VEQHRRVREEARRARERANRLEQKISRYVLKRLGVSPGEVQRLQGPFLVWFKDLERWGVDFNILASQGASLFQGKYSKRRMRDLIGLIQYGTSEKAHDEPSGVPVLRMNNIIGGQLDVSNLKYLHLSRSELEKLKLVDGDILFNRTNSKELVGKCAVFHESGEYVFASYLIRVRLKPNVADPDFVAFIINSPIGRRQIDTLSRQIIGQANINTEELKSLEIPLPSLAIQREIMARVKELRAEIAAERQHARQIEEQARREVEEMLLGTRPVSAGPALGGEHSA